MLAIEPAAQAAVRHQCSGVRRVNEAAASHIYADVIDVPRVDSKEKEVPGKQVPQRYGSGRARLLRCRAWNHDSGHLVGVDREPAAIEPPVIRAAESVRRPDETLCDGCYGPSGVDPGDPRCARGGGAAREQSRENEDRPEAACQITGRQA